MCKEWISRALKLNFKIENITLAFCCTLTNIEKKKQHKSVVKLVQIYFFFFSKKSIHREEIQNEFLRKLITNRMKRPEFIF